MVEDHPPLIKIPDGKGGEAVYFHEFQLGGETVDCEDIINRATDHVKETLPMAKAAQDKVAGRSGKVRQFNSAMRDFNTAGMDLSTFSQIRDSIRGIGEYFQHLRAARTPIPSRTSRARSGCSRS